MEESEPLVAYSKERTPKRSNKTSIVLVAVMVVVIVAIAISVSLGVVLTRSSSSNPVTCNTDVCTSLAKRVLGSIDTSIDPCQDFYNFSCGGWIKTATLPPGKGRYGVFDEVNDKNQAALKALLEGNQDSDVNVTNKLRGLYQECLNTGAINALGAAPLLSVIEATGGSSLLNGFSDDSFDINSDTFFNQQLYGSGAFFNLYVSVDDTNSSRYILMLSQSGLTLPTSENYLDNRTRVDQIPALVSFISTIFTLLNSSIDRSIYVRAAEEIAALEEQLAKIFVPNDQLIPSNTYNSYELGNLSTLWSYYDWEQNIMRLLQKANVNIPDSETIIVTTPTYFKALAGVLNTTNASIIENYALWQLIRSYIPYLGENFTGAYYNFSQKVQGSGQLQRYQTCISYVQSVMPMALARIYTLNVLPNGTKEDLVTMISKIEAAFQERLSVNNWLDDTTRDACDAKVNAITQMVAYPDYIYDTAKLLSIYDSINTTSFFTSYESYVTSSILANFAQLRSQVDKTVWLLPPTAVNAYYSPNFNQFVFLEGILNIPFIDIGWPPYFKYGAMGVVIGHELTHGFDNTGQQYNKDGIFTPWWTNNSVKNFIQKQGCFESQYSKYEIFGYNVNGNLTLGENIADNGGLETSYQAYRDVSGNTSPLLPGVRYTQDQLYFIAFGQVWCSLLTPSYIQSSTKSDPHSPGPFRVIGAVQNSMEFANAFNCKAGTPMNPNNKCTLW